MDGRMSLNTKSTQRILNLIEPIWIPGSLVSVALKIYRVNVREERNQTICVPLFIAYRASQEENGSLRVCVVYRKLNIITKLDSLTLQRVDTT